MDGNEGELENERLEMGKRWRKSRIGSGDLAERGEGGSKVCDRLGRFSETHAELRWLKGRLEGVLANQCQTRSKRRQSNRGIERRGDNEEGKEAKKERRSKRSEGGRRDMDVLR